MVDKEKAISDSARNYVEGGMIEYRKYIDALIDLLKPKDIFVIPILFMIEVNRWGREIGFKKERNRK